MTQIPAQPLVNLRITLQGTAHYSCVTRMCILECCF